MAAESPAKALVCALREKSLHVTAAESCTGGAVASAIVSVAGASDVFERGYVTYSISAKEDMIGVPHAIIKEHGVVSRQTAAAMAECAAKCAGADMALSTTGVAGPDASDGIAAGIVYVACYYKGNATVRGFEFEGGRNDVRNKAVSAVLELALERLSEA